MALHRFESFVPKNIEQRKETPFYKELILRKKLAMEMDGEFPSLLKKLAIMLGKNPVKIAKTVWHLPYNIHLDLFYYINTVDAGFDIIQRPTTFVPYRKIYNGIDVDDAHKAIKDWESKVGPKGYIDEYYNPDNPDS